MTGTAILICPKCRGTMRTYERNGVLIDQCEECRGIFLDRGELERLIDAESDHDDRGEHDGRDRDVADDDDRHQRERHGKRRTSPASLLQDFLGGGE